MFSPDALNLRRHRHPISAVMNMRDDYQSPHVSKDVPGATCLHIFTVGCGMDNERDLVDRPKQQDNSIKCSSTKSIGDEGFFCGGAAARSSEASVVACEFQLLIPGSRSRSTHAGSE
jgi:hypothetical protein